MGWRRGERQILGSFWIFMSWNHNFIAQSFLGLIFHFHEIESSCGDQRQSILFQVRLVWTLDGIEQPRCWSLLGWCAFPTSSVITVTTTVVAMLLIVITIITIVIIIPVLLVGRLIGVEQHCCWSLHTPLRYKGRRSLAIGVCFPGIMTE